MKIAMRNKGTGRLAMFLICMIPICMMVTGWLAAQTGSAKPEAAATPDHNTDSRAHDNKYIIGVNDVLAISVWKEPEVSKTVPVRSDGKISLPLAGEVQASGETPLQLEQALAAKLRDYISEPEVTVIVEQIKSRNFNVLGQVARPGSYPLASASNVLDAIAIAGGFRDFAKRKSIYVLRRNPDGTESRMPFNYKDVIKGKNSTQNIQLEPGDTVVVP